MRISKLVQNLHNYMDMYGDQPVSVHSRDSHEDLEIVTFDAFKNKLSIEVGYIQEDEEEE